jgi:hypothetical protein
VSLSICLSQALRLASSQSWSMVAPGLFFNLRRFAPVECGDPAAPPEGCCGALECKAPAPPLPRLGWAGSRSHHSSSAISSAEQLSSGYSGPFSTWPPSSASPWPTSCSCPELGMLHGAFSAQPGISITPTVPTHHPSSSSSPSSSFPSSSSSPSSAMRFTPALSSPISLCTPGVCSPSHLGLDRPPLP